MTSQPDFIVISGLSGSGKSTAVRAFEDLGSYCVDNLPTALLPRMIDLFAESSLDLKLVVLGMDMREMSFMRDFPSAFREIRERGVPIRLFFFTASEKVLVRRFSETRRTHPLGGKGTLVEAIRHEARELDPLVELADRVIDTSEMNLRDLREEIARIGREAKAPATLSVSVLTFGYKYGLPYNTDLVFDVRFLPNPFFVQELKHQTGLDEEVRRFVMGKPETEEFLREYFRFLGYLLPRYREEGRAYLTIGIGCTGGRHRSVVIAQATVKFLETQGCAAVLQNRDIHSG